MKMNIRTKLIGGFLIVVALLLVVFGVAYNGLNTVASGAEGIKKAAELDDAIMGMHLALLEGMDAESRTLNEGYSEALVKDFQHSIDLFDEKEAVIEELGTAEQQVLLKKLISDHDAFIASVQHTIALVRETGGHQALQRVNNNATPLFKEAAQVVQILVASQSTNNSTTTSAAIDQAGAQRMRIYKMAYLANNYARATGDEGTAIITELEATVSEFDVIQAGLRSSDATLLAQLDSVNSAWSSFKADLQEVLAVSGKQGEAMTNSVEGTDPVITELTGDLEELEE